MFDISKWFVSTAVSEKIDALEQKIWMDELTWRTAFGKFIQGSKDDWSFIINESTKYAVDDVKQAQSDADLFSIKTPVYVSVPLKLLIGLAALAAEVAAAVWAAPYCRLFVESLEGSHYFNWWLQ